MCGDTHWLRALWWAVAMICSCVYWALHLCLLNRGRGASGTHSFSGLTAGQRWGGAGWPHVGGTPDLGPLHWSASC